MNERIVSLISGVVEREYNKQFNTMLDNPHPEDEAPLKELSSRAYDLKRSFEEWRADDVRQWCQRVMDPECFKGFVDWYLVQRAAAPEILSIINKYFR
ncbi:MAG: hypothetical protein WC148_03895 [Bacilli bacterium]